VALLCALLLLASGQPLFTDDAWWHLALGEAFAQEGPRLAADPLLFTAPGPPSPASWGADVILFGLERSLGFAGLRLAHVAIVAGILVLAGSLLWRASRSAAATGLGTAAFAVCAAYRLVQLRPHLFSILATLVLARLLFDRSDPPSWRRIVLAAVLLGVWSNLHAGFVLGPISIGAATAALLLAAPLRTSAQRALDRRRAVRLAAAFCLGVLATLANPSGLGALLPYLDAGASTPALARVGDEWSGIDLLRLPPPGLPPSPLAWALLWGLFVGTASSGLRGAWGWRRPGDAAGTRVDPALLGMAVVSLGASLSAVRFLWLAIFPLLLLASWLPADARSMLSPRSRAWLAAALAALLLGGFVRVGDWRSITSGMPRSWAGYAQPYAAAKYHAHAVWLMQDAGLEGNLFNEYVLGGFLGYWLSPRIRTFVNGSLNVSKEAIDANLPLRMRRGVRDGESFPDALDRLGIDLFLGIRLPEAGPRGRPWFYTTGHLEGVPGWIQVFRNLRSALYLRDVPRNSANLERLAGFYAREGVPFDRERGFEPERVIREAPAWAIAHGVIPVQFAELEAAARDAMRPLRRDAALDRLASLYATLGLYERAIRADRHLLAVQPEAPRPRRRLAWSLLREGHAAEALEVATSAHAVPERDALLRGISAAARGALDLDVRAAAARAATLPVFTRLEAAQVLSGFAPPPARADRR
jgi:hypothetical protein